MKRFLKAEDAKYRQKMDTLNAELNGLAQKADGARGEIDRLNSAKGRIEKDVYDLEAKKASLQTEIAKLGNTKDQELNDYGRKLEATIKELSKIESEILLKNKEWEKTLVRLNEEITKKLAQAGKLKDLSGEIIKLEGAVQKLELRKAELEKKNADEKVTLDALKSTLDRQEKEIDDKFKKDSAMRTQADRDLRLLEHYVKRLQRRYDKEGIRIDLLKQFNIVRDRK